MPVRAVTVPGTITLVPSRGLEGRLLRLARDHPDTSPLDPQRLVHDLGVSCGVPTTLSEPHRAGMDWSLRVHTVTHVARLYPSRRQDAYIIGAVHPLRHHDHHALAQGHLVLRPAGWRLAHDLRHVGWGSSGAYWERLRDEWGKLIRGETSQEIDHEGDQVEAVRSAERLVTAATWLLPALERSRFDEEFRGELWDLADSGATGRRQIVYGVRQLIRAGSLRAELMSRLRRKGSS